MKRKFAKLKNQGVDLELSIALMWTKLNQSEKELLSFNQLRWVMKNTPSGSKERIESSKIFEDKTQSFKKFQSFFEITSVDSYKVIYIWKKLKEKTKTLKRLKIFGMFFRSRILRKMIKVLERFLEVRKILLKK